MRESCEKGSVCLYIQYSLKDRRTKSKTSDGQTRDELLDSICIKEGN